LIWSVNENNGLLAAAGFHYCGDEMIDNHHAHEGVIFTNDDYGAVHFHPALTF
jgi:hypothetical protein